MNHKRLRRLYAQERLQVRRRGGRKRALGTRAPIALPQAANQRCSLEFASTALAEGRRSRPGCPRRFLPRMPGLGGRHIAMRTARGARTCRHHRRARPAPSLHFRRRHRADQHGDPDLVAGAPGRVAPHRARQATAERVCRILHRPPARRVPERDAVRLARTRSDSTSGMAARLQRDQAAQRDRQHPARDLH